MSLTNQSNVLDFYAGCYDAQERTHMLVRPFLFLGQNKSSFDANAVSFTSLVVRYDWNVYKQLSKK